MVRSLKRNNEAFAALGVNLTTAAMFQSAIEENLMAGPDQTALQGQNSPGRAEIIPKKLVSAEDVRRAQAEGITVLTLSAAHTIITPLAREVAEELGIRFELQLK